MSISDPFPNTPQENSPNKPADIKEGNKSPEEKLRQEFLKRTFLVVEDHPNFGKFLITEILKQRGVKRGKEDSGVILITNYQDFTSMVDRLFSGNPPANLLVILDLNFPNRQGDYIKDYGGEASEYIRNKIKNWNSEHLNQQIILEIIMNSSNIDDMKKAQAFGAVGFSKNKTEAVSAVKELLLQKLETSSS